LETVQDRHEFVLLTDGMSHAGFRSVPNSVTFYSPIAVITLYRTIRQAHVCVASVNLMQWGE